MAIDFSALPYDILVSICASVTHRQTLIACSLVCRSFHDAVKPTLYRDIVFNDTDDSDGVFGVIEAQPHLRGYVRSATHITTRLERTGSLWDDKEDRKPKWPNPLSRLYNLDSYTLRPSTPLHPIEPKNFDFLLCISCVLSRLDKLRRVHFAVDMDPLAMSFVSGLLLQGQLTSVTLGRTEIGTLSQLSRTPDMVRSFSSIRELHILEMGGIDAQELQNVQPLLGHLTHLTFGPGHKLTKDVLLESFLDIPQLEELTVFYDNFLNGSIDETRFFGILHRAKEKGLPALRSIIVQHQGIGTAIQFSDFFSWIDALCIHCPLERLEIHSDDGKKSYFDHSILKTLGRKHLTLRRLVMPRVLVRREVLLQFLQIIRLDELRVGVDRPKVTLDPGRLSVPGWMTQSASVYSQGAR